MNSSSPKSESSGPLRRTSLPEKAAQAIRDGILAGRWGEELPSESELCREFQISRMTLRTAIHQLVDENHLCLGGRGHRHKINSRPVSQVAEVGSIIRILTPHPPFKLGAVLLVLMESLREKLGSTGYAVEIEHHPKLYSAHDPKGLSRLNDLPGTAGWVVFASTEPMQRWFAEQRIPCVIVGPLFPGIELSCLFADTTASARHAVGVFHKAGHRELAYFTLDKTTLGDRRGLDAFVSEKNRFPVRVTVVNHAEGPAEIRKKLNYHLLARPRPTAFFTYCAEDAVTILCHLQNGGYKVPEDFVIIAGWDDHFLHHTVPPIASYHIDGTKAGRRLASLLLGQIGKGGSGKRQIAIIPDFLPGGTVL